MNEATAILKRKSLKGQRGLRELIAYTNVRDATLVEVGSYAGESARIFAASGRFKAIHCVDPWSRPDAATAEKIFDETKPRIVKKHKMTSLEAAPLFEDGSLHIVYLDGDHSLTAVRADIKAWLPKVRPGGWITGHDYFWRFTGVLRGVYELLGKPHIVTRDSSWGVRVREGKPA